MPELERPAREPAPSQGVSDDSQEPANTPPGPAPRPGAAEAPSAFERVWWRRMFDG